MKEYIEKSIVERMLWAVIMSKEERTIEEMLEYAQTVQAIPLDKDKQARRELDKLPIYGAKFTDDFRIHLDREEVFSILDKLIEESEE